FVSSRPHPVVQIQRAPKISPVKFEDHKITTEKCRKCTRGTPIADGSATRKVAAIAAGSSRCLSYRISHAVSLQDRVLPSELRQLCQRRGRENRIVDGSHSWLDQRNADPKNGNDGRSL